MTGDGPYEDQSFRPEPRVRIEPAEPNDPGLVQFHIQGLWDAGPEAITQEQLLELERLTAAKRKFDQLMHQRQNIGENVDASDV